jgi:ATP-dependent Clp protease adaptor protein ClpS
MTREKENPGADFKEEIDFPSGLILYNDEVNTFDFVIACLVEVCDHEYEQAEQCAITAHFKGKCHVKSGGYEELKPQYELLSFKGLTVSIE